MSLPRITAQSGGTEGGVPVVILEVQATGLSAISAYPADILEVVVDGKSALLAPEGDVGRWQSLLLLPMFLIFILFWMAAAGV